MSKKPEPKSKAANTMWGGQYSSGPAETMQRINNSLAFDQRLYAQDIAGSLAHCQMLEKQKIITAAESKAIQRGLRAIKKEIEQGHFPFREELEDIHMNIEARLKEIIGDAAGKLHTARSRNDQVATDFRLWVRDAMDSLDGELKRLQSTLITRAQEHAATLMPGFTHLQVAQPVTLGHHLLAYVEMFGRDRTRLNDARARLNECPLGAAALAGTSFPIDRNCTARILGFTRSTANSLDSVSDRDFALEFLSITAICAVHLSRLAEEFVLWSSTQFGFITLSDAFTTGSSIMPQKRNPDGAELVRGKTGRIIGALVALLTTIKALPLAYNKDMQEDKEPVFDAFDQLTACIAVTTGMMADFTANSDVMHAAADSGYATATDLADWLVQHVNMPFRQAHHVIARIVHLAAQQKKKLHKLTLADMRTIEKRITPAVFGVLSAEHSAASRTSAGGTAPANVRAAVKQARKRFL